MSRLLTTQLPQSTGEQVDSGTYNRLIRVLELNLGTFDPDNTRQMTQTERDKSRFNQGSLIWNTNVGVLQVWTGYHWLNIGDKLIDLGYEVTASLGQVTVATNGDVSIDIGTNN
jgi:hypothetical protein|tara:strand:- start:81 stop:422 length:342 start_codon:yes stop_codon:yes gene_type:complete